MPSGNKFSGIMHGKIRLQVNKNLKVVECNCHCLLTGPDKVVECNCHCLLTGPDKVVECNCHCLLTGPDKAPNSIMIFRLKRIHEWSDSEAGKNVDFFQDNQQEHDEGVSVSETRGELTKS